MSQLLPLSSEILRKQNFCAVEFPSRHGHPGSRETAQGASYMARAFFDLLKNDGIPCEYAKVSCPHRSSALVERLDQGISSVLRQGGDNTAQLRQFKGFREEAQSSFDTILPLLERGHTLFLTAGSHDAVGRVLAFKEAFPAGIVLDFDKHPDLQVIGSGDAPGDGGKVNGHAIWAAVVTGFQDPVFKELIPDGSTRFLERSDLMMIGIHHPDRSEVRLAEGDLGGEKLAPIPYVTAEALHRSAGNGVPLLEEKLRDWIDERKERYGVSVIPIAIEDDPDSCPLSEIGPGNTMPTPFGIKAETKYFILRWLARQKDVKVMYYGTSEVRPKSDKNGMLKKQILQWAGASFGLGDTNYYHGGYNGSQNKGTNTSTATSAALLTTVAACAAVALCGHSDSVQEDQGRQDNSAHTLRLQSTILGMFSHEFTSLVHSYENAVRNGDEIAKNTALKLMVDTYTHAWLKSSAAGEGDSMSLMQTAYGIIGPHGDLKAFCEALLNTLNTVRRV